MLTLFALGSNGSGQLGLGHEDDVNVPTEVIWSNRPESPSKINCIVAGGNHTIILPDDGQAFFTGDNGDGRCLGQPIGRTNVIQPVVLGAKLAGCKILLCACTWEASIAVLEDGRVISSGTGERGELGLGADVRGAPENQVLKDFPPLGTSVVDLVASMNHVVAVLSNGEVYGWGSGRKGQLGTPLENSWHPRRLDITSFFARRAVVGTNFTYIFGDGESESGNLIGLGSDKWSLISGRPSCIPNWANIAASWGSIFVLTKTGGVICWGRNDHCQLAPGSLSSAVAFAAGSEHAVCLTDDNKVMTWGWGEHGNCGHLVEDVTYDSAGAELSLPGKPVFIAAGCATTWIGALAGSP